MLPWWCGRRGDWRGTCFPAFCMVAHVWCEHGFGGRTDRQTEQTDSSLFWLVRLEPGQSVRTLSEQAEGSAWHDLNSPSLSPSTACCCLRLLRPASACLLYACTCPPSHLTFFLLTFSLCLSAYPHPIAPLHYPACLPLLPACLTHTAHARTRLTHACHLHCCLPRCCAHTLLRASSPLPPSLPALLWHSLSTSTLLSHAHFQRQL